MIMDNKSELPILTELLEEELFSINDLPITKIAGTAGKSGTASNDEALSGPHFENTTGDSGDLLFVNLTLMTSKDSLSKRYVIDEAGNIKKSPKADMYQGAAERLKIPFKDLVGTIKNATPKQALVLGTHAFDFPDKVQIRVNGKENPGKNILARTKSYYDNRHEPGVLYTDHDPSEYGQAFTPHELLEAVAKIHPAIKDAAHIIKGSVSSGVIKKGETPKLGTGFHIYFPVKNAADISRYGEVLFKRLWLDGFGFIALGANGSHLVRSPIDKAVFSPERLDFICPPIVLDARLEYIPGEIVLTNGNFLDTTTLNDLSADEEDQVKELIQSAKQAIEPKSKAKQSAWASSHIDKLVEKGSTPNQAKATIDRIINSGFQDLYGDFSLDLSNGSMVTVAEILKNP